MGIYSKYIFPRLMDSALSGRVISKYRQNLLSQVTGNILEIGFGTGLNLPNYPSTVKKISTVDINPGMNSLAKARVKATGIEVVQHLITAEKMPFEESSFDTIVSTWTLCSIPDVDKALSEVYRLLKPKGQFLFLEHGLSNETSIQIWQNRLNRLQNILGDGCHFNRNIASLVAKQPWQITEDKQFYIKDMPKIASYMYQGTAIKT
ncbi:MAG: class I SAM-dependent methyltransferase [Acidobacteria bacterium]|nr:class I SAM-dependent methyltransferase [Acidobacteriota bacterium]